VPLPQKSKIQKMILTKKQNLNKKIIYHPFFGYFMEIKNSENDIN